MSDAAAAAEITEDSCRRRLRRERIAAREAVPADTIADWSARVCHHLRQSFPHPPGRRIGFCWPVRNEPDVRPVIAEWLQHGTQACLPVVVGRDMALSFRLWTPESPLSADRFGVPTPLADAITLVPDVLLIPLNAFDDRGFRLGYGGGFFDRTLAALSPRPLAIGIGFEIGRVASVSPQPHDQRLDWIVSEAAVTAIG